VQLAPGRADLHYDYGVVLLVADARQRLAEPSH
jgi:hypothetical protein